MPFDIMRRDSMTLNGTPSWIATPYGIGMRFNFGDGNTSRSGQRINLGNDLLYGVSSFTIATLVKYTPGSVNHSNEDNILSAWAASTNRQVLFRFDSSTSRIELFTFTSSQVGGQFTGAGTNLEDSLWHIVVARYNGALMELFVDGIKNSTTFSQTGAIGEGTGRAYGWCGEYISGTDDGRFDMVIGVISKRAWSDDDVARWSSDPFGLLRMVDEAGVVYAIGAVPQTITPSAIAAPTTVQSPVVSGSGSAPISPGSVAAPSTVQAPSIAGTGAASVSPSSVAASSAVQAPTVSGSGSASISPSALAAPSAVQAPALSGSGVASIAPTPITAPSAVVAPSIATGAQAISPAAIVATSTVQAPAVAGSGAALITPASIAAPSTVQAPAVAGSGVATITLTAVSVASSVVAPVIALAVAILSVIGLSGKRNLTESLDGISSTTVSLSGKRNLTESLDGEVE